MEPALSNRTTLLIQLNWMKTKCHSKLTLAVSHYSQTVCTNMEKMEKINSGQVGKRRSTKLTSKKKKEAH